MQPSPRALDGRIPAAGRAGRGRSRRRAGDDRNHLGRRFEAIPSPATVWRILRRHGLITPQPHKRPRFSFVRFEAALPNELWQADTTHWRLADGSDIEILNLIDDHSRLLLAADAVMGNLGPPRPPPCQTCHSRRDPWEVPLRAQRTGLGALDGDRPLEPRTRSSSPGCAAHAR